MLYIGSDMCRILLPLISVVRKADVLSKDLNVGEASGSTVLRMQKAIAIYNNYRNELIPGIDYDGDRPGDP